MKMWSHFLTTNVPYVQYFKMYDLKAEIHYQFKRISLN